MAFATSNGDDEKESLKRAKFKFVSKLEHPRQFTALVVAHLFFACAGFMPAIVVFLTKGQWWVNPLKQPVEWAHGNHPTMKLHAIISLLWIALSLVQYVLTTTRMFISKTLSGGRAMHYYLGYAMVSLLVAFTINANYLAIVNGVAGKVLYNFLALITGSMMMWHLIRAIIAIRKRDRYTHIHEMCGLLSWTCFPGIIRGWAILPLQYFFLADDCDSMSTSGMMAWTLPLCAVGLAALRWAALGEEFNVRTYDVFYVLTIADILLGLVDNTLFRCNPEGSLLEQVPGKAWTLQNW